VTSWCGELDSQHTLDVAAILLAAGAGERLGGVKKAFLQYDGKSLLEHEIVRVSPLVKEIVIALQPEDQARVHNALAAPGLRLVQGAADRLGSLWNAVQATASDHILVCDVARPFVSQALIKRVLEKIGHADAVIPALPFRIRESIGLMSNGYLETVLPREGLVLTQTPQAFKRVVLIQCLENARANSWPDVSLAGIARLLGIEVAVVSGDPRNRKITFPEDLSDEFEITDPPVT